MKTLIRQTLEQNAYDGQERKLSSFDKAERILERDCQLITSNR